VGTLDLVAEYVDFPDATKSTKHKERESQQSFLSTELALTHLF